MTDSISTNNFTSAQYVSNDEAAELEKKAEGQLLSQLSESALSDLTDIRIKLTNGGTLTAQDAETLKQMGEGLTAKDLDTLVQQGKLSRGNADLLLAATSLNGFHDGGASNADIAKGLNNIFVNMKPEDREFTLNLLSNQGQYERTLNIGENGAVGYTLSANGQELSPGDLPSTPAIERALMAIMDDNFKAEEPGAIKAFANWDFDTSRDEMSALLGGMKSYENLSDTQRGELMAYLAAAGQVAAGNPFAATQDPADIAKKEELTAKQADMEAAIAALQRDIDNGGHVEIDDWKTHKKKGHQGTEFTKSDGTTVTLGQFLRENGIPYANKDGDQKLGQKEWEALMSAMQGAKANIDRDIGIVDMKLSGASAEQTGKLEVLSAKQFDTQAALALLESWDADHRHKDRHQANTWNMTFTDHAGNKQNLLSWAHQNNVPIPAQVGNSSGMNWQGKDWLPALNGTERDNFAAAIKNHLQDLGNQATAVRNEHKAEYPEAKKMLDDLAANSKAQLDMARALELLSMADEDKKFVKLKQTSFTDSDGNKTNLKDFFDKHNIDIPGNNNILNNKESDQALATLQSRYDSLVSAGNSIQSSLDGFQPPKVDVSNVTTRSTDYWDQSGNLVFDPDNSVTSDKVIDQMAEDQNWDPSKKNEFGAAVKDAADQVQKGESPSPSSILDRFGLSDSETIDIGLLMFVVQSERIKLLGDQIQDIIKTQRQNTRDQQDMQEAMQAVNSAEGNLKLKETNITLKDGTTTDLASFLDSKGVKYNNDDGDFTLGDEEKELLISNIKGKNEGLSNEGQAIMNELTMLSQKYQQAQSLAMNFLEKFDAMKQKIIDKIRAN